MPELFAGVSRPGDFEPELHFYERVRNAHLHPLVRHFMSLGNERIAARFARMYPAAATSDVLALLQTRTKSFAWAGADLFLTTSKEGGRGMMVIETNSCPSGQKSMPRLEEGDELAGYRTLIARAFLPRLAARRKLPRGGLAVVYDKNPMEATGYAAALAELAGESVHLVPLAGDSHRVHFEEGVMQVPGEAGHVPIRAAIRYVTQRPWDRIPPVTRTFIFNPTLACLAGGRNKAVAAKAYDLFNAEHHERGLAIRTPETIWDVARAEVPMWIKRMGGVGVVKNPYSNAGQGVYTITSDTELTRFMDSDQRYDKFIVQALIGNQRWSSRGRRGRLYHVGTLPTRRGKIFAADLRCMVCSGPDGFHPVAMYARRAREPLSTELADASDSWAMLGTNLSVKRSSGEWTTETDRLILVDSRDFNKLGVGVDDLIEAYLQTVMATIAIDQMGQQLVTQKGRFRRRFFRGLTGDPALEAEVCG